MNRIKTYPEQAPQPAGKYCGPQFLFSAIHYKILQRNIKDAKEENLKNIEYSAVCVISSVLPYIKRENIMVCSASINRFLTKTHMPGPLIRLTGLVISAVAMQMIINGIQVCFSLK